SGDRIGAGERKVSITDIVSGSGRGWVLGGALVLALLAAGGWYGKQWLMGQTPSTSLSPADVAAVTPQELTPEPLPLEDDSNADTDEPDAAVEATTRFAGDEPNVSEAF